MSEPVRIVPYDPVWPGMFEEERAVLEDAIGSWVTDGIHHVGSTAVPGLSAKPVIDILVGVEGLEESLLSFERLVALDYLYSPYRHEEMHWFVKPDPDERTHQLHLVPADSPRFRMELRFRDVLRGDDALAGEYAGLKHDLAEQFEHDREAYTEAKTAFVTRVLLGGQLGR